MIKLIVILVSMHSVVMGWPLFGPMSAHHGQGYLQSAPSSQFGHFSPPSWPGSQMAGNGHLGHAYLGGLPMDSPLAISTSFDSAGDYGPNYDQNGGQEMFDLDREQRMRDQQRDQMRERMRDQERDARERDESFAASSDRRQSSDRVRDLAHEADHGMFGRNKFDDLKPNRIKLDDEAPKEVKNSSKDAARKLSDYLPPLNTDDFEVRKSEPFYGPKDRSVDVSRPMPPTAPAAIDEPPPQAEPTKRPIEVKRQTVTSPSGHLTYITEMVYDVQNNPFKVTTGGPGDLSNFLNGPQNGDMFTTTEDSRPLTQGPNPFFGPHGYMGHSMGGPLSNVVHMDKWRHQSPAGHKHQTRSMPTPPTPFKVNTMHERPTPNGPLSTSERPSQQPKKFATQVKNHKMADSNVKMVVSKKMDDTSADGGLGATAIAGIVIGSLVSVALLAALFVMYKSPFGKPANVTTASVGGRRPASSGIPTRTMTRGHHHYDHEPPGDVVTDNGPTGGPPEGVRVYRFPPRRDAPDKRSN